METTCSGSFAVAQAGLPGIVTRVRERRTVLCVALPVGAPHDPVALPRRTGAYQDLRHVCENGALFLCRTSGRRAT